MKKKLLVVIALCMGVWGFSQAGKTNAKIIHKPVQVQISTNFGNIIIQLSDSTPLHRDNFVKLVKEHFFDSLLFHRVIQGFMIQGGDPDSKNADSLAMLGSGEGPGDRIPAEFNKTLIHQKGALAAARDDNPLKASSNCQFYIVQGKKISDEQLNNIECNIRGEMPAFYYTEAQRKIYKTIGGTPMLDQNYTVFGQVIKGLDVIDKIAALPTDQNDRPLKNVRMKIKLLN
ncbi:MAG: peptidylprolyl isomerase [Chitinophagaceae bacterium]